MDLWRTSGAIFAEFLPTPFTKCARRTAETFNEPCDIGEEPRITLITRGALSRHLVFADLAHLASRRVDISLSSAREASSAIASSACIGESAHRTCGAGYLLAFHGCVGSCQISCVLSLLLSLLFPLFLLFSRITQPTPTGNTRSAILTNHARSTRRTCPNISSKNKNATNKGRRMYEQALAPLLLNWPASHYKPCSS